MLLVLVSLPSMVLRACGLCAARSRTVGRVRSILIACPWNHVNLKSKLGSLNYVIPPNLAVSIFFDGN